MRVMRVTDTDKHELKEGTRVYVYGTPPENSEVYDSLHGTVIEVTDLDGDVDDEGRSVAIMPEVRVRFDSGHEESFTTSFGKITWADYPDGPDECECEDLVLE